MIQDFAKRHTTMRSTTTTVPGWVWFLTGLVTGVFVSFLAYLWKYVPIDPQTSEISALPEAEPDKVEEEMSFFFYTLFPKSEVPVLEEYGNRGVTADSGVPFSYVLQVGSFRTAGDADRLRAQLLLLGMEVSVTEVKVENNRWHRVMVGPFSSNLDLNRTQDRLAEMELESIPLKVSQ